MEKVYDYIDARMDDYVGRLRDLCAIPTVSARRQELEAGAAFVEALLRRLGAEITVLNQESGYPLVVGRVAGAQPRTLLVYNHYDVVPPEPLEDWTVPPFAGVVRDGRLIARGACDNKGDLIARLCAVEAYLAVHGQLPIAVTFALDGEEEIGSPHLRSVVEANRDLLAADACLGEGGNRDEAGRPTVSLGSRGRVAFRLESKGAARSFHSSLTTIVFNPAWDIIWAFASMKGPDERVLIDGFYDDVVQPTAAELELLKRIRFDEEQTKAAVGVESFTLGITGLEIPRRLLYEPTLEASELAAGPILDGLQGMPRRATGTVRFGLVPYQQPERIGELLRRHLDRHGFSHVSMEPLGFRFPGKSASDHPAVQAAIQIVSDFYQTEPVVFPISEWIGAPIWELAEPLGMPYFSVGTNADTSRFHVPDESIELEDFRQSIKFMATLIHELATNSRAN
jgi:acetylornithine deacetylase/succinyl-diaminopimelate desuccinylase-like protein